MKITDPEVIKSGESELIDAITADMDWGGIGKVFMEKHKLDIDDDVEYKSGDIVVYDNQIAYKLEFDVKVNLSILLDREGTYISLSTDLDSDAAEEDPAESAEGESPEAAVSESDPPEPEGEEGADSGSEDNGSKEKDAEATDAAEDEPEQPESDK